MEARALRSALATTPPLRLLAVALILGTILGIAWPGAAVLGVAVLGVAVLGVGGLGVGGLGVGGLGVGGLGVGGLGVGGLAIAFAATNGHPRPDGGTSPRTRLGGGVVLLALLAGALRGASAPPPPAPPELRETPVVLEGTAADAPKIRRDATGARAARFRLRLSGEDRVATVGVRLHPHDRVPEVVAGDVVQVTGRCTSPGRPTNPGQRDHREALRRSGIVLRVTSPTPAALHVRAADTAAPLALMRRGGGVLRSRALRGLRAAVGERADTYAVLAALLVGERSALRPDIESDFRRGGAAHLLAVSGLHVILLVGAVSALVRALTERLLPGRRGRIVALVASLTFLVAYAATCRLATPVVRAATFMAVALAARHVGRRTGTADHLAAAAALVAAVDPAQALQPGFHLSFSAVLGLCTLTPRFREALFAEWDLLARFPEALPAWRRRAHAWIAAGASASLAASTATAPVAVAVFGELHPIAPVTNLLAVPLVAVLLPAAGAAALLGGAVEPIAGPLLELAVGLLTGLLGLLGAVPGASVAVGDVPSLAVAIAVIVLVAGALVRPWRRRHLAAPALCWAVLLLAPATMSRAACPRGPSLVALDVGHGVAVLLRGGEGGSVLYDAGGRMPGTAERIVVPALRALGVDRLSAVAISHEDSDHSAAVPDLIERMPVGAVLVPMGFGGAPAGKRVLRACARRSVPVIHMARGDTWALRDVRLFAVHPDASVTGPAENEGSLVLHATLGSADRRPLTALLPGDVEGTTLDALAADRTLPRAEVLLLPHHGRGDAEPQVRLAALCRAQVLIASTPETAPTAVPGALSTGREGALLVTPGRAPVRLVPNGDAAPPDSGL